MKKRRFQNIITSTREMDNSSGAIGWLIISKPDGGYMRQAIYFTDNMIMIVLQYPWNKDTIQILRAIHIEKVK